MKIGMSPRHRSSMVAAWRNRPIHPPRPLRRARSGRRWWQFFEPCWGLSTASSRSVWCTGGSLLGEPRFTNRLPSRREFARKRVSLGLRTRNGGVSRRVSDAMSEENLHVDGTNICTRSCPPFRRQSGTPSCRSLIRPSTSSRSTRLRVTRRFSRSLRTSRGSSASWRRSGGRRLRNCGMSRPTTLATSLGNTNAGDGKRFKGRGPIQITGRANYRRFGDLLHVDLVSNPALRRPSRSRVPNSRSSSG